MARDGNLPGPVALKSRGTGVALYFHLPGDRLATATELLDATVDLIAALRMSSYSPADAIGVALGAVIGLARQCDMPREQLVTLLEQAVPAAKEWTRG